MIERIILSALLAASIAGNGWQWWTGAERYDAGRAFERAQWVARIAETNREIERLNVELTKQQQDWDNLRRLAALRAGMIDLPVIPESVVALCSLPDGVRAELNRIGGEAD